MIYEGTLSLEEISCGISSRQKADKRSKGHIHYCHKYAAMALGSLDGLRQKKINNKSKSGLRRSESQLAVGDRDAGFLQKALVV